MFGFGLWEIFLRRRREWCKSNIISQCSCNPSAIKTTMSHINGHCCTWPGHAWLIISFSFPFHNHGVLMIVFVDLLILYNSNFISIGIRFTSIWCKIFLIQLQYFSFQFLYIAFSFYFFTIFLSFPFAFVSFDKNISVMVIPTLHIKYNPFILQKWLMRSDKLFARVIERFYEWLTILFILLVFGLVEGGIGGSF